MKRFILLLTALSICALAQAQDKQDLNTIQPDGEYDNIHVKKISHDSLATCFVIWVKNSVKPHRHKWHTENIYVIEGEGTMVLDGKEIALKPGDFVNIPKNSVHSVTVTSEKPMKVLSIQAPIFTGEDRFFVY